MLRPTIEQSLIEFNSGNEDWYLPILADLSFEPEGFHARLSAPLEDPAADLTLGLGAARRRKG